MNDRAGTPATADDLVDLDALIAAYYDRVPDVTNPEQKVVFGTSGHRGSSLDSAFNDTHIAAITQAIVEYRTAQGTDGPLFIGRDTHALSGPAERTALEVLAANGVHVLADADNGYVPTPALSHAIIAYNTAGHDDTADGIVITPSHNPPRDGGFKYNPPHGGPADSDATTWIADRANAIIAGGNADVQRAEHATHDGYDFLHNYVADLENIIDIAAIKRAGVKIGADPLGGASLPYWNLIRDHYGLDLTVVNPDVDPTWSFMTLDWDGKIRMDPSSPSAMASVVARKDDFDVLTGNDADSDRHGIVTPDGGLMNPNHYLAVAIEYLYAHRPRWRDDAAIGKTLVSSSIIDRDLPQAAAQRLGDPVYQRVDAAASKEQKARLSKLDGDAITAETLAGDPITAKLSKAPGNDAAVGGVKVVTDKAWFAARPSGTEDVYKIYAESFVGQEHLEQVQREAKEIVDAALGA
jgi:phosphoglucomutase